MNQANSALWLKGSFVVIVVFLFYMAFFGGK